MSGPLKYDYSKLKGDPADAPGLTVYLATNFLPVAGGTMAGDLDMDGYNVLSAGGLSADTVDATAIDATTSLTLNSAPVATQAYSSNASNLTSGTISDARLSSNVPKLSGGNSFSGNQVVTGNITTSGSILAAANGTQNIGSTTNYFGTLHVGTIKTAGSLNLNTNETGYGLIWSGSNGFWDADTFTIRNSVGVARATFASTGLTLTGNITTGFLVNTPNQSSVAGTLLGSTGNGPWIRGSGSTYTVSRSDSQTSATLYFYGIGGETVQAVGRFGIGGIVQGPNVFLSATTAGNVSLLGSDGTTAGNLSAGTVTATSHVGAFVGAAGLNFVAGSNGVIVASDKLFASSGSINPQSAATVTLSRFNDTTWQMGTGGTANANADLRVANIVVNGSAIGARSDIGMLLFNSLGSTQSGVGIGSFGYNPGFICGAATGIAWTSDVPASARTSSITQASAGVLQIGTGGNNANGSLNLAKLTAPGSFHTVSIGPADATYGAGFSAGNQLLFHSTAYGLKAAIGFNNSGGFMVNGVALGPVTTFNRVECTLGYTYAPAFCTDATSGQEKGMFSAGGFLYLTVNRGNQLAVDGTGVSIAGLLTASGVITSGFRSLSANPTTLDIASNREQLVKNTTNGELRRWANDGGSMKSILYA